MSAMIPKIKICMMTILLAFIADTAYAGKIIVHVGSTRVVKCKDYESEDEFSSFAAKTLNVPQEQIYEVNDEGLGVKMALNAHEDGWVDGVHYYKDDAACQKILEELPAVHWAQCSGEQECIAEKIIGLLTDSKLANEPR